MKKSAIIILLVLCAQLVHAQAPTRLERVNTSDDYKDGMAMMYGSFVQRLAFSSGGFQQEIRLVELNTQEIYTFNVKPAFRSKKKNIFSCIIPPGRYAILNYYYTRSEAFGGTMYEEPIYKGVKASHLQHADAVPDTLLRFVFEIQDSTIHYLGTWHFDTELVYFTNNKAEQDAVMHRKYNSLNFDNAAVVLPE